MAILNVLGLDPSLRNWGLAAGKLDTETGVVDIRRMEVFRIPEPTGKNIRANSKDLAVATGLFKAVYPYMKAANLCFAEVPYGSKSARGMVSYAVSVALLGAARALDAPFLEVSPLEVKLCSVGTKTATKAEMIAWAMEKFPNAPWPYHHGQLNASLAEHMADACAAIHAGLNTQIYQQLAAMR